MQLVYQKKSRFAWSAAALGNDDVSIVYARKYEMVRMTKNRKCQSKEDRLFYSHTSILLSSVWSVTFFGAAVLKVMDLENKELRIYA